MPTLTNYLGTGSNPRLCLTLGDNQAGWKSYRIDYQQAGNVPNGWSAWNVTDEFNNYYGTITLTSDGTNLKWGNYAAGKNGYYLEDIILNNGQLSLQLIHRPDNKGGPFADTPPAKPAVFNGTNTPIKLSVTGSDIVDNFGRKVKLKGVVRPSLEWNTQGQFLSADDIKQMSSWGSNTIRLDLNQDFWLNSQDASVKGSYKQIIDAIIYEATKNNMAVILDLHWLDSNLKQAPMADTKSLEFWRQVATAYKDFGTVIFELYNEPYQITQQIWLDGDGIYVGYQQMHDVVRATGANNPVIINGLDYAYDLSFVNDSFSVKGTNIIYGSHPYNDKGASGYTGPGGSFENNFRWVLGKYPLIFTEFGDNQSADYQYPYHYLDAYTLSLNYASQNNLHYTSFAWWVEPTNPAFPTLISDWNGTPVNGGALVHDDLQKNPPTNFFQPPDHVLARRPRAQAQENPILSHLTFQLVELQEMSKANPDIQEVIKDCLKQVLQFQSKDNLRELIDFVQQQKDEIKRFEQNQACWPFGFFCRTSISDSLDKLINDVSQQIRQMPSPFL